MKQILFETVVDYREAIKSINSSHLDKAIKAVLRAAVRALQAQPLNLGAVEEAYCVRWTQGVAIEVSEDIRDGEDSIGSREISVKQIHFTSNEQMAQHDQRVAAHRQRKQQLLAAAGE